MILFRVASLLVFFFLLTGGAFLFGWEYHVYLSERPYLLKLLITAPSLIMLFFFWKRFRHNPEMTWNFIPLSPAAAVISLAVLFWSLCFSIQTFMQLGMNTSVWDLGLYDQVLWNTAKGDFLITSIRGGVHLFAERFKPIFVLLSGIYLFQDSVYGLFAFTLLLHASSIFWTYGIARHVLQSHKIAVLFALGVILYLPYRNGIHFLFHSQMLADPFILMGIWLSVVKRSRWALIPFLLAVMCKESVILDILGLGLFLFFTRQKGGLSTLLLGIFSLILFVAYIEPHYAYAHPIMNKWSFFKPMMQGNLPALFHNVFSFQTLHYLILITGPFLFAAFFANKWWMLWGPSLLFRLLSSYGGFRLITAHYTGGLDALIIVASIFGFQRLKELFKHQSILPWLLSTSLLLFAGLPQFFLLEKTMWDASFGPHQRIVKVLKTIPQEASVMTSEFFAPHLSHRRRLYVFNQIFKGAPYEKDAEIPNFVIVDTSRMQESEKSAVEDFHRRGYSERYRVDFMTLYARSGEVFLSDELLSRWKKFEIEPVRNYHKRFRHFYRRLVIVLFIFTAFYISWITFRKSNGAHHHASYA